MKPLKSLVLFIVFTTLFACKYEVVQELKTSTVPEFIPVSKIIDSEWVAASNFVSTVNGVVMLFKIKHL